MEKTFGGILKRIHLGGKDLHDDEDERQVTIITDDERPAVFYGKTKEDSPLKRPKTGKQSGKNLIKDGDSK